MLKGISWGFFEFETDAMYGSMAKSENGKVGRSEIPTVIIATKGMGSILSG